MTASSPDQVGRAIAEARVVAVIRHERREDAATMAESCLAGGLRVVEVTMTVPDAAGVVADLVDSTGEDAVIGAGTVLDAAQVEVLAAAGARFLVSPVTDPAVQTAGQVAGILTIPGALTPTEIADAHRRGASVVKLFPAGCVGPSFIRATASVLPTVRLLPTGGVGEADVAAWLDAGSAAVGIGSAINAAYTAGGAGAVEALAARLAGAVGRTAPLVTTPLHRSAT
jgi:2-dehydro-3-deoxyphosphogluconate aldolase / (4S)-4-hydroxy-2-oxoglutarate aldolase